eukprot:TRINITY_DN5622_c0_g2_i1.p1 TRINITY_DN5622_c0_g2~~TRINITY_DN5622_c0_g2_i1.p1  ORF type:complete len:225 (-),score=68.88 TRINITY_DN5622_c0_g2_i1:3-677(-)
MKTPTKRLMERSGRRQSTSISSPRLSKRKDGKQKATGTLLPISPSQQKSLLGRRHSVSVSEVDSRSRPRVSMMNMLRQLSEDDIGGKDGDDNDSESGGMSRSESKDSEASVDEGHLLSVVQRGDSFAGRHKSTDFDDSVFSSFDEDDSDNPINILESAGSSSGDDEPRGVVIHYVMIQNGEVVKNSLHDLEPSETGIIVSQDHFASLVERKQINFLSKRYRVVG